jgi:serine/threonine-protein kinase HipA
MNSEAYVWIWLPGATAPVVCARLLEDDGVIRFVYGRSYRERANAIVLDPNGPVLSAEPIVARVPEHLPGPIVDAAPDRWGRRVIEYRLAKARLSEIDYLLAGGGDRIGALHFQASPDRYQPPVQHEATLEQLMRAAQRVEAEAPLPEDLYLALEHGTSIGGARPKATLRDATGYWIAKFGGSTDRYPFVEYEFATLRLARECGIQVPEHKLLRVGSQSILLLRRFDRHAQAGRVSKRLLLSALTLLKLDETEARLAGYPALAEVLRRLSRHPLTDAAALFRRMIFNILIGNTDDHAKNHACFWDGHWLDLTPAYDLLPVPRVGQEGRQAMAVGEEGPLATLSNARSQAGRFGLLPDQADTIIAELRSSMTQWQRVFVESEVHRHEVERLADTTIISPAVLR